MNYIVLIMKVTRNCNLSCLYCRDKKNLSEEPMSFEIMASAIASSLTDKAIKSVVYIWHGGEPTLIPLSFYEKAIAVQSRFSNAGQKIENELQTNGTLLNEEWVHFLKENEFCVGISLDGPCFIHNKYRPFANGRGSYKKVLNGINLLKENEVPFSVLSVVDESTIQWGASCLFDFFLHHEINNYGLISVMPSVKMETDNREKIHYVGPTVMSKFLCDLYDRWLAYGDSLISIREIDAVRNRLLGKDDTVCSLTGNCFGFYFLVDTNGDVSHCDCESNREIIWGNILKNNCEEIRNHDGLKQMVKESTYYKELMMNCPEFKICRGWCPHQRLLSRRYNSDHRNECCGLKSFIQHVRNSMVENGEL